MLTPEEIQSREFLVSLRGYDRDEVHAFLDEVAEAFAQLLSEDGAERGDVTEPAAEAAPAPAHPAAPAAAEQSPFAAIGAETQRILEAAQAAGDEIRRRPQAEADQAREEALAQARQEVDNLRQQAVATQQQIELLEQRRGELSDRLREARERVDVALAELDDTTPEVAPADATNSVLASEAVATDVEVVAPDEPDPVVADARPAAATPKSRASADELPLGDVDDEAADDEVVDADEEG